VTGGDSGASSRVDANDIPLPGFVADDGSLAWKCPECGEIRRILQDWCLSCGTVRDPMLEPWARLAVKLEQYTAPAVDPTRPNEIVHHSPAYDRFIRSMTFTTEAWQDGEGYDLEALREMEGWERPQILEVLRDREATWREIEVFAAVDHPAARAALDQALQHRLSITTRLAAAEALHEQGRLETPIDQLLAGEIRRLDTVSNGCTRALLLAERHPSDAVQQALLWASYNRSECSMHCAALLCFLRGVAKEPFDWNLRPLFLRLGPNNSILERKAAFDELSALVKMELDTSWQ
jgi:hypothetical protein